MSIIVYGIKNCDTIKKTIKKLDTLGVSYDFFDYKKQSIDAETVKRWVNDLGIDKVLNKRGTTWRKLTNEQKQAADTNMDEAIDLLVEHTSMIKRPIIEGDYDGMPVLLCGYDEAAIEHIFG